MATDVRCKVALIAALHAGEAADGVLIRRLAVARPTAELAASTSEVERFPRGTELMQEVACGISVIVGVHEADSGDECEAAEG
jgi:hypothetical protein